MGGLYDMQMLSLKQRKEEWAMMLLPQAKKKKKMRVLHIKRTETLYPHTPSAKQKKKLKMNSLVIRMHWGAISHAPLSTLYIARWSQNKAGKKGSPRTEEQVKYITEATSGYPVPQHSSPMEAGQIRHRAVDHRVSQGRAGGRDAQGTMSWSRCLTAANALDKVYLFQHKRIPLKCQLKKRKKRGSSGVHL